MISRRKHSKSESPDPDDLAMFIGGGIAITAGESAGWPMWVLLLMAVCMGVALGSLVDWWRS